MDATLKPIEEAGMPLEMCKRMATAVSKSHGTITRKALIHTGFLSKDRYGGRFALPDDWVETSRKLRLLPLSFLATQNLKNTKMIFWANADPSHPSLQEIFAPLRNYSDFIELRRFDPSSEMAKIAAKFAPKGEAVTLTARLLKIFKSLSQITSKSDIMRTVLLYNYGGLWMDSDVLMIRDLAPLLEEDWVTLLQAKWVNQAIISVSKPGSPFITAYLKKILEAGIQQRWGFYGPWTVTPMAKEMEKHVANRTFHILPRCFFEGGFPGETALLEDEENSTLWNDFFIQNLDMTLLQDVKHLNYVDPSFTGHTAFGYHWHNRWNFSIVNGSLADRAEKLYCQKLHINLS